MPGAVVHSLLAATVLQRWRQEPAAAPVDPCDHRIAGAFFRGSVAPDMGFYPGATPRVSHLAHRSRSGDLVRALVLGASTDLERAFAWGWLTHVLADLHLHPAVNRASGSILHGSPAREVPPAENKGAHLRLELGLDARMHRLWRTAMISRPASPWPAPPLPFLVDAFQSIHATAVSATDLARSDRALTRFLPLVLRFTGLVAVGQRLGGRSPRRPIDHEAAGRNRVGPREWWGPGGPIVGVAPTACLLRALLRVVRTFPDAVGEQLVTGIAHLPNHDLDTGEIQEDGEAPARLPVRVVDGGKVARAEASSRSRHRQAEGGLLPTEAERGGGMAA